MRTVLLFPGALGDVVLLAPAVASLTQTATVALSVQRAVTSIAGGLVPAALGPPMDGAPMSSIFSPALAPSLAAWLRDADVVHVWIGRDRDTVRARLAEAGVGRVAFHGVRRGDGARHASRAYAGDLGVRGRLPPPRLRLPVTAVPVSWRVPPAGRLVVHPGAGAVAKRWSQAGLLAVADGWRARGGEVTVLCGPAEDDLLPHWQASSHRVVSGVDLVTAAAVVASASLYAGHDSGISHLAGALARAGAVLFGPTRAARWRPRGGRLRPLPFDVEAPAVLRVLAALPPAGCLDTPPNRH